MKRRAEAAVLRQPHIKGMTVSRVLTQTGTITGSSAAGKLGSLEKVEGVLSVADDTYVELPPTGSKPQ